MKLARRENPDFWNVSPFEHLNELQSEINRLFENPLSGWTRTPQFFNTWAPAMDLYEDKDNLVVESELPGMKKDDIEISIHEGALNISGERKEENRPEDSQGFRSERFYGRFHRTIALPKPVEVDKVSASYKDGILRVVLPKAEEAKPRQIEVKVG